ncbi:hypothetical protein [Alkalilimnicola ehrlichii]|uniref:hypothetical protein n=1 Tax=Alkalilimnicola ehrlichii TaxID=351052 RepID=UPI0011C074F9|nr:hypothetical protein [Alkalilimnicola ehrlichii]
MTVGNVYHVLTILTEQSGNKWFRVVTSERDGGAQSLGLYPAECFEVLTDFRPSSWRNREINGSVEVSPASWQAPGFWEDLYDGDPNANLIFEKERRLILEEEP